MKVLELFAGRKSIGKEFIKKGHYVFSVEWDKKLPDIQLYKDIEFLDQNDIPFIPDVIWASPDCKSYSVAGLYYHRNNTEPKSDYAAKSDRVNKNLWNLIDYYLRINPNLIYFVENPRCMYRKMPFVQDRTRYTVTYCQYGETRMKPTDIFTNHPDPQFKPPCKNGSPCHISAPRGSVAKGTTQGQRRADRSLIPEELCKHIVSICESLNFPKKEKCWYAVDDELFKDYDDAYDYLVTMNEGGSSDYYDELCEQEIYEVCGIVELADFCNGEEGCIAYYDKDYIKSNNE